jgi:hypothetical protein
MKGFPATASYAKSPAAAWARCCADTDLASLRDTAALAKLPAREQKGCARRWAGEAALL